MKIILYIYILLTITVFLRAEDNNQERDVRTFIGLLDYLGSDYRNAVDNGVVLDEGEFKEMNEFINNSINLFERFNKNYKINNSENISNNLLKLQGMIINKSTYDSIFSLSNTIKSEILKLNLITVSPRKWPNIMKGKDVFLQNCTSCHGNKGDGNGELVKNLLPKPANFLNNNLMESISPLQIYNTVRLGIAGTAMKPLDLLTDEEVWDVAFYVSMLRFKNSNELSKNDLRNYFDSASQMITLENVTILSDKLLINKFEKDNGKKYLASLRMHQISNTKIVSSELAFSFLDKSLDFYKKNDFKKAGDMALDAYLQGVEPYEKQLDVINPKLKKDIEFIMFQIRSKIKSRSSISDLNIDVEKAKLLIKDATKQLEDNEYSFWFAFLMAATIILREGIEAFLIIITILGVLKSINADKAKIWVHSGWITALFIGFLSLIFINYIVSFGAKNRELLEAVGSMIAVILLLYIGFWLHNKTSAKKWKEFIENKILKLVDSKNMLGLAIISFVVVFREAFESAIFLSAVNIEVSQQGRSGLYLGAISSLIFVLILSRIALIYASKLPIKQLFKYSALIMIILSVVIAGKGIRAFQEGGFSSVTSLNGLEFLDFSILGIFPTLETLIGQILIIILSIFLWNYSKRTPKLT